MGMLWTKDLGEYVLFSHNRGSMYNDYIMFRNDLYEEYLTISAKKYRSPTGDLCIMFFSDT